MHFVFILALALGRNLSDILKLPLAELNAWKAYYNVFPFGDVRGDIQSGIVASTLANVNRARGTKAYGPDDFIPKYGKVKETSEEVIKKRIDKFMMRYR